MNGIQMKGLVIFKTNFENLPLFLFLGAFKRRPDIEGEWIRDKERRLGYKILPYKYCKEREKERNRSKLEAITQL